VAIADSKDKMMVANTESMMSSEKRFAEQSAEVDSLKSKVEAQGEELTLLRTKTTTLEKTNGELVAALEERKQQVDSAMEEVASMARADAEAKQQLADAEGKVAVEQQCGAKLSAQLGGVESKLLAAEAKVAELETSKADLAEQVATLTQQTADLTGALDELKVVQSKLEAAEATVKAARTGRDNVAAELAEVQKENESALQRLAAAERLVSSISVEKLRAVTEVRTLTQKLEAATGGQGQPAPA